MVLEISLSHLLLYSLNERQSIWIKKQSWKLIGKTQQLCDRVVSSKQKDWMALGDLHTWVSVCVICTQESLDLVTILLWVCKTTSSISHFCVSLLYFCKMDIMILFASQEWQGTLVLVYSVLTCSRSAIEKWSVNWFMNCQPCIKNRFNISILSELTQKKAITYDKVGRSGFFLLKCTQMLIIV